jgi:type IV pilus assembly protein PilV
MKFTPSSSSGSALLEVLITIVILAFGLLGVAGLQARIYVMEYESYQRAQAVVILNDIAERLSTSATPDNITDTVAVNTAAAVVADYAAAPLGGAAGVITNCSSLAGTARDICELSNLLNGGGEKQGTGGVGAMDNAMACITPFIATATKAFNRCQAGVQIDVVWRGRSPTIVPIATCGTTGASPPYGATDAFRRAVSLRVGTGDVVCPSP